MILFGGHCSLAMLSWLKAAGSRPARRLGVLMALMLAVKPRAPQS